MLVRFEQILKFADASACIRGPYLALSESAVYLLCCEKTGHPADLSESVAHVTIFIRPCTRKIQFTYDRLRRDIAGKIPELPVSILSHKRMAEHRVKHQMKIGPCEFLLRFAVRPQDKLRVAIKRPSVCCKASAVSLSVMEGQRRIHVPEVHQQSGPDHLQNFFGKSLYSVARLRVIRHLLSLRIFLK